MHLIVSTFLLFGVITGIPASSVQSHCEIAPFVEPCVESIKSKEFTFLKTYKLDGQGGKKTVIEYPHVFSIGTTYIVTMGNGNKNNKGLVLTLMDPEKKVIATTFNEEKKEYYPDIQLDCKQTGIFYLSFSFQNTKDYCGAAVLGFKRK